MSAPAQDGGQLSGGQPRQTLSVHDAVGIIVGLIVGAGIFGTPSIVAGAVGDGGLIAAAWIAGGVFSIIGALCYGELATAFPSAGAFQHIGILSLEFHVDKLSRPLL